MDGWMDGWMDGGRNHTMHGLSLSMNGASWDERRDLLMRLTQNRRTADRGRAALREERERLEADTERLENENHSLARQLKELQLQLFEKRTAAQKLFQRSDHAKKKLVQCLSRENNLLHEIRFLESEREKHGKTQRQVASRVEANMGSIAALLRDIEFLKGEVGALLEKTGMLEQDAPLRCRDIENLDEKIAGSLQALIDLYQRMQAVEKNVKSIYYRKGTGSIHNLP
jgi:chromosome segregation ATPase